MNIPPSFTLQHRTSRLLSRRTVLRGAATLSALGAGPKIFGGLAHAASRTTPPTPFVKRVVRSPDDTYFTYPHSNGFLSDREAIVARPTKNASGQGVDYILFDPSNGTASVVAHVKEARTYYAISQTGLMAVPTGHGGVVLVDLKHGAQTQVLNDPSWGAAADIDISKDGTKILVTQSHPSAPTSWRTAIINMTTSTMTVVTEGWATDHAHFSPHDETWVCFCDNRQPNHDRMWVWNAKEAPQGRHLFNEQTPDGQWLNVGHERAMFNKRALLTIAFGESAGSPRGLYEVQFDGKVRLVSESNCDFHCNVSHDGRWAVVTAEGVVADDNGNLNVQHKPVSGWIKTEGSYGFSDVMIVNLNTGARRFLYRGTNDVNHQPYEVQPSISPDDRWVLIKDAREKRVLALEIDQAALTGFLA